MHDEVSETENIRKNLAIERMIVDGCDLLLDVNQVFVRQGTLIQVICDKPRSSRSRLGTFGASSRERKEAIRQVFLFTNHLLITARTSNGRLRLVKNYGKISLVECTLVEDTTASFLYGDEEGSITGDHGATQIIDKRKPTNDRPTTAARVSNNLQLQMSTSSLVSPPTRTSPLPPTQLEPICSPKPPTRADSGPPAAGCTIKRHPPIESMMRYSGGFTLNTYQWTNCAELPHRHSTSLCTERAAEADSRPSTGMSSSIGKTSLPTHQLTGHDHSGDMASQVTSSTTSVSSFPLFYRLGSNFGLAFPGASSNSNNTTEKADYGNLDFRLIWEPKNGQPTNIWLVASTLQEKAAWCSDISQCIEQLHYGDILNSAQSDVSSVTMPQSIRSDPRLFKDDVDIKFSQTLNSCKVPQIRHATVDRLLDRLTDARFLSIDFLNTFLLTYRVFTTGLTVILALKQLLLVTEAAGDYGVVMGQRPTQSQNFSTTSSSSANEPPSSRDFNSARPSDTSLISRLPVLEEKTCQLEALPLEPTKTVSSEEDVALFCSVTEPYTPSVKCTAFGDIAVAKRPVSTSDYTDSQIPNNHPLSPEQQADAYRMCNSEIVYRHRSTSAIVENSDVSGPHVRSLSPTEDPSNSHVGYSQYPEMPESGKLLPPLIPRSPIFGGLLNARDDPPLELPDLSNLSRDNKHDHSSKPHSSAMSPRETAMEKGKQHTRLAPLASCEAIPDENESTANKKCSSSSALPSPSESGSPRISDMPVDSGRSDLVSVQRRRSHSLSHDTCSDAEQPQLRSRHSTGTPVRLGSGQTARETPRQSQKDCSVRGDWSQDTPKRNSSLTALDRLVIDRLPIKQGGILPHQSSMTMLDIHSGLLEKYMSQHISVAPVGTEHEVQASKPKREKPPPLHVGPSVERMGQTIHSNVSPITDSLDLATKLKFTSRTDATKHACQMLAKSTMFAALNYPGGLVKLRTGLVRDQVKWSDRLQRDDNAPRSAPCERELAQFSPSSPKQRSSEVMKVMKLGGIRTRSKLHPPVSATANNIRKTGIPKNFFVRSARQVSSDRHSDGEPCHRSTHPAGADDPPWQFDSQPSSIKDTRVANNAVPENATDQLTVPGRRGDSASKKNVGKTGQCVDSKCVEESNEHRHQEKRLSHCSGSSVMSSCNCNYPLHSRNLELARVSVVSWSGMPAERNPKRPSVFSCPDGAVTSTRTRIIPANYVDQITSGRTRAGAVVTSSRRSKRRSSNTAAVQAFAVATAGSASPLAATGIMGFGPHPMYRSHLRFSAGANAGMKPTPTSSSSSAPTSSSGLTAFAVGVSRNTFNYNPSASSALTPQPASNTVRFANRNGSAEVNGTPGMINQHTPNSTSLTEQARKSIMTTASCLRVLNVVRHWITKFPDDFDSDQVLKSEIKGLLESLVVCPHLLPNDQKAASQLLRQIVNGQLVQDRIDLDDILTPTQIPSAKNFDTLSALDISEQLTFLDFQIFRSIRSDELLNQSWMKPDKEEKAKHVLLVCKRFNEVSRLVVSEIISRTDLNDRVSCIDKWVAIANICRCLQNYNGVLQICAALVNSSVYRLRRTWERVGKQTKQSIDRLQMLVASDGRFKSMREALHRCDPPCIPYLGMYLTDLSFIEEGALNVTENNLVNFCKMRMIAHVIREIQQFHQTPYMITHRREVTDYLLDTSRLLDEEETYRASLTIEPRQSISRQLSTQVP